MKAYPRVVFPQNMFWGIVSGIFYDAGNIANYAN